MDDYQLLGLTSVICAQTILTTGSIFTAEEREKAKIYISCLFSEEYHKEVLDFAAKNYKESFIND